MSPSRLAVLVLALSLTLLQHLAWAAIVNRTIDDSSGDPITGTMPEFLPNISTWNDHTCAGCRIRPDVNRAFGNSWHETTYNPQRGRQSIVIPFNGTAIYIFFILVNNAGPGITTETECNFVLNSEQPVPYRHEPNTTLPDFLYNQLVFSRSDLPQRQHILEVVIEGYDSNVYLNFDYAIYTHDDTPPPTTTTTTGGAPNTTSGSDGSQTTNPSNTPVGAIAGGVVGGILFVVAALLLFFCLRRRRKQKQLEEYQSRPGPLMDEVAQPQYRVDPFTQQSAYHRGPSSNAVGSSSEPLYSPVPQQSQHRLDGTLSSSMPNSSQYSQSSYPGIATTRWGPSDSDQATTVTGSSSAGGTQFSAGASSTAAGALASTFPREKGNRSANPPLPPLPAGASRVILTVSNPEEVRQVRQAEIGERLRTVEQEMNDLKRGLSQRRPTPQRTNPRQNDVDGREDVIVQMREQMMQMQQEIQMLRDNQRSDWAMGLTDEPPPGYSANPTPRPLSEQQRS